MGLRLVWRVPATLTSRRLPSRRGADLLRHYDKPRQARRPAKHETGGDFVLKGMNTIPHHDDLFPLISVYFQRGSDEAAPYPLARICASRALTAVWEIQNGRLVCHWESEAEKRFRLRRKPVARPSHDSAEAA